MSSPLLSNAINLLGWCCWMLEWERTAIFHGQVAMNNVFHGVNCSRSVLWRDLEPLTSDALVCVLLVAQALYQARHFRVHFHGLVQLDLYRALRIEGGQAPTHVAAHPYLDETIFGDEGIHEHGLTGLVAFSSYLFTQAPERAGPTLAGDGLLDVYPPHSIRATRTAVSIVQPCSAM